MTRSNSKSPPPTGDKLTIAVPKDADPEKFTAKLLTGPFVTNAYALTKYAKGSVGDVKLDHVISKLEESAKAVKAKNLEEFEELLTSQAIVLNTMFGELSRRSAANMGEYIDASQRYFNMALKAQNQCRLTLETLSAIKNPPVIYAKQANIANGPQQVNNGVATASHAGETGIQPNKQLETTNERPLDAGTPRETIGSHKAMATVGKSDRTTND